MTKLISYWDDTLKKYLEVSTTDPLPTTAVGSGAGGSEQVTVTGSGGDAVTGAYASTADTVVGLTTNARMMGTSGANSLPIGAEDGASDARVATEIGLLSNARLLAWNGTSYDRVQIDTTGNLKMNMAALTTVGTHGNAWNNVAVSANGVSPNVDCRYSANIAAFGTASAATVITIQVSQDDVNWYDSSVVSPGASGGFYINDPAFSARFARLKSSAAATITATVAGKA